MKTTRLMALCVLMAVVSASMAQTTPVSQMEKLNRGVVALPASGLGNFVSWRLLGTDPKGTTFDVICNGAVVASDLR